jgi:high-affinity Fe2+/Pb2+ permease
MGVTTITPLNIFLLGFGGIMIVLGMFGWLTTGCSVSYPAFCYLLVAIAGLLLSGMILQIDPTFC